MTIKELEYIHCPSVTSTNEEVLLRRNNDDNFCVYADYQSKGRGQEGTTWCSDNGLNMLASVYFTPFYDLKNPDNYFAIIQIVSTSICEALSEYVEDIKIKWPNDIYVGDKKLAGILIETSISGSGFKDVIAGVGLNVNQEIFPDNIPNPISLKQIVGEELKVAEIVRSVCNQIYYNLSIVDIGYTDTSLEVLHKDYMSLLYKFAEKSKFSDVNGDFIGTIVDVEQDGRLVVKVDSELRKYFFKEIVFKS